MVFATALARDQGRGEHQSAASVRNNSIAATVPIAPARRSMRT